MEVEGGGGEGWRWGVRGGGEVSTWFSRIILRRSGRGELRLLGERTARRRLLHGRRLLLPPEGSAVGVGGGEKLGLRRRLLLRRRQT